MPAFAFLAMALLIACAPTRRGEATSAPDDRAHVPVSGATSRPEVRAIFLVHGDGEYSWHDSTGRRRFADQEAVKQAREAGLANALGEVYLFHLRKGRKGWFKEYDGRFEHYLGGARVESGTYVRTEKDTAFEAEARILRRHRGAAALPVTRIAYFGHELPLRDQPGYFPRNSDLPFSQARFAQALGKLQPADFGKPYAAIVLSMCYGGSPGLIEALRPFTDRVAASPAYLHLSYLDARAIADPAVLAPADTVAARSFARLSREVRTEVTVAVYDLDKVRPPVAPATARPDKPVWKDCSEAVGFDGASAEAGTRLLYRPPRFGAGSAATARSAWQCGF